MLDKNNKMQFCPYCGFAIQKPESYFDYKEFVLNHKENSRRQRFSEKIRESKHSFAQFLMIIAIPLAFIIFTIISVGGGHTKNTNDLHKLSAEIEQDIIEGRLDEAYTKTLRLRIDDDYSEESKQRWDQQREDYQKLIKEKQKERP